MYNKIGVHISIGTHTKKNIVDGTEINWSNLLFFCHIPRAIKHMCKPMSFIGHLVFAEKDAEW